MCIHVYVTQSTPLRQKVIILCEDGINKLCVHIVGMCRLRIVQRVAHSCLSVYKSNLNVCACALGKLSYTYILYVYLCRILNICWVSVYLWQSKIINRVSVVLVFIYNIHIGYVEKGPSLLYALCLGRNSIMFIATIDPFAFLVILYWLA